MHLPSTSTTSIRTYFLILSSPVCCSRADGMLDSGVYLT